MDSEIIRLVPFGEHFFRCELAVSFREGRHHLNTTLGFNGSQAAEKEVIELRRKLAESQARENPDAKVW